MRTTTISMGVIGCQLIKKVFGELENRAGPGHAGGLRQVFFFAGTFQKRPDDIPSTWTNREVEVESVQKSQLLHSVQM